MDKNLYLTDLISTKMLQDLQNIFSELTGMAALTSDVSGVPVTQGSNFTDFCMKYTRECELGKKRCETCDKMGAEITRDSGRSCTYICHAGLIDFAAPIMAGGRMIGSFIGGQVLTAPPDLEKVRRIAGELGIDPDEYVEAISKVRVVDKKEVERASNCLYTLACNISNLAYQGYSLLKSNEAVEKAAKAKSDFLANMSHEIRTPMNAVLGMADLALREDMSETARGYIHQIKTAGKNLLVIINDILDFSKIESGKMDIIEVEYEPLSVVNDVSSIVNNRIGNKNVEFTMDIAPNIPKRIWGDNVRIHQIILNLLTNAVKFTKEGQVNLSIKSRKLNSKLISLMVSVSDTGQGIRKEDINKIFHSFQQVDSKRNRNIEGTGLGLAITQRLLSLMHGTITVNSEYGKGSTFYFEIPQKIIDPDPIAVMPENDITAALLVSNTYVRRQMIKDLEWLCKECIDLSKTGMSVESVDADYYIIDRMLFNGNIKNYFKDNPNKQCLVIDKFNGAGDFNLPNVRILRKPVYSISLYNAMGMNIDSSSQENSEDSNFTFIAPEASVLIVDDNQVNLVVASGLLEPLQMHINTAMSAEEAINMIETNMYDLIFMDHMMPEVDGVEATHIIRRLIPAYESIPIIALSANAIGNAKAMFINEGMNDFVAKPIEVKDIVSKLRKWLPQEKIIPVDKVYPDDKPKSENKIHIEGIDVESAISLIGSERLFMTVLKEYYTSIDKKSQTIVEHKNAKEWREYTVEVHALKSISKQVGANHVSELAAKLEQAGNKNDIEYINKNNAKMIEEYRRYKFILKDLFSEDIVLTDNVKENLKADPELVLGMLNEVQQALDEFDTLLIDEVVEKMTRYDYSDEYKKYLENLKDAAENGDIDECGRIVSEWKEAVS